MFYFGYYAIDYQVSPLYIPTIKELTSIVNLIFEKFKN